MVGRGDDAHVVLDDHDGVAGVDQSVQLGHQHLDVGRVQAGGRLVQQVERVPAPGPLQLAGQLDPLRLPAGQLGRRLAEVEVAQPHVLQRPQAAPHRGDVGEERAGLVDDHVEHVGDAAAAVGHLEGRGVVARARAGRAGRVGAGQEQQLHRHEPLALTGLAPAALDVEREPAGAPAARPRLVGAGEQRAHPVEQAGVRRQVGPRRAPDRLLVHLHQTVDRLQPRRLDGPGGRRPPGRPRRRVSSSSAEASSGRWVPRCRATTSASTWLTRVDLPEPETPVTAVRTPSGTSTSRSRTLCRVTPDSRSQPVGSRRARRAGRLRPSAGKRKRRVADSGTERRASTGPLCRTRPPALPAPGPTSTTQSARRTTSMSCSTTNRELPAALRRSRTVTSGSASAGCRPADGSSST